MIHHIRTIDAHTAGEPLRLVVDGLPAPEGATMLAKRQWAMKHLDHLRRALMLEPRGHADMYGALLTEPVTPGAHAGVLFMHNEGWSTMCGHGVIAVSTIAVERGLMWDAASAPGPGTSRSCSMPRPGRSAPWPARPPTKGGRTCRRCRSATCRRSCSPPACRCRSPGARSPWTSPSAAPSTPSSTPSRRACRWIAGKLGELKRVGMTIARDVERAGEGGPPGRARPHRRLRHDLHVAGAGAGAHLRNVTIFADAEVDRSPCGTGTAAVMAVLDEMGVLGGDAPFVHESIIGTCFSGASPAGPALASTPAIVPEIAGSAWITGEHTFLVDGDDPLRAGLPALSAGLQSWPATPRTGIQDGGPPARPCSPWRWPWSQAARGQRRRRQRSWRVTVRGGHPVLVVTIDTLRRDRLGAYGHTGGLTPVLDRLAARGVRVATPSRTSRRRCRRTRRSSPGGSRRATGST